MSRRPRHKAKPDTWFHPVRSWVEAAWVTFPFYIVWNIYAQTIGPHLGFQ